jgi:hypothetical protein
MVRVHNSRWERERESKVKWKFELLKIQRSEIGSRNHFEHEFDATCTVISHGFQVSTVLRGFSSNLNSFSHLPKNSGNLAFGCSLKSRGTEVQTDRELRNQVLGNSGTKTSIKFTSKEEWTRLDQKYKCLGIKSNKPDTS